MLDRERDADPVHARVELHAARTEHPFAVGDGDDGVFDGRCRFDLHLRLDTGGFGRDLRLAVEYVFQTQLVPALKFYRTPDARRNQPRTPVPAVMIARLAGEGAEFFPVESPVVRLIVPSLVTVGQGFVLRQGLVDRGVEIDAQYVAALLEQGFDFGGPAAEHVVRRQDPGFVQEDVGIGVQTEELQPDVFVAARQRSGVEGDFVDPVFLVDPLQGAFVEPVVGIFDQSVVQQVGVHHARHRRRMPFVSVRLSELPAGVERHRVVGGRSDRRRSR